MSESNTSHTREPDVPPTVAGTLENVDEAWLSFRQRAIDFPVERLDERIGDGWTRKQMLAHIAAWHELTSDRLVSFMQTGERQTLGDEDDVINARVARSAEGRTTGEVFDALETSFRRLRRQISHLSGPQLAAHDGWSAGVIAGNTYGHYEQHRADLDAAED